MSPFEYSEKVKNNLTAALKDYLLMCDTSLGSHQIIMWARFTEEGEFICGIPMKFNLEAICPEILANPIKY